LLHAQDDRHHAATTACDTAADRAIGPLPGRARRLHEQAPSLTPPLAEAYRRRAAEFDLQACLEACGTADRPNRRLARGRDPQQGVPECAAARHGGDALQRRLRGTPISHTESADNEWAIGDPEHTGTPWDVSGNG
jgi:hypothetical protein